LTLRRPASAAARTFVFEIQFGSEGEPGLGIGWIEGVTSRPVFLEAACDFAAPFRLLGTGGDTNGNGLRRKAIFSDREMTEGTLLDVLEQEGATLRAYSYHWSVLRCGGSSGGTRECYHDWRRLWTGRV
jgi:hypothetical protein